MNLLSPPSFGSFERHPCMACGVSISFKVVRDIRTPEEVSDFVENDLNHAVCPACGNHVVAPVRVRIRVDGIPSLSHEFIPYHIVENPEVMKDLLKGPPAGVHQVFTMEELHTAIIARTLIEVHRSQKAESPREAAWDEFPKVGDQLVLGI